MVATKLSVSGAAVLLAVAGQVSALGSAVIRNQCDFPVYLWSVSSTAGPMQELAANGGEYSEAYQINPDGGGIAIKVGRDTDRQEITQYEYTLEGGALWYDLSNINGYPFMKYGVTVVPSSSSCRGVTCPAGTQLCGQAYNVPDDNFATAECDSTADTVVVLCSGETDTSGSASVSSIASQAASTDVPVTVFSTSEAAKSTAAATTPAQSSKAAASSSIVHTWSPPAHHSVVQNNVVSTSAAAQVTQAAAPAVSEAAALINNNPYVVVHTTFVTHVVTVEARAAQPTVAAEAKRDVHHEHAAVHHDHHARRHQHARAFARSS